MFVYLGGLLDESGMDEGECCRKASNERKVVGGMRPLVNARSL